MRRLTNRAPRLAGVALVTALLGVWPASARDEPPGAAYNAATGIGAMICTLIYTPMKISYAAGGTVISGLAWLWTRGDGDIAGPIFWGSVRGDYVVTPRNLDGRDRLEFIGRRY